jgi:hypothetical protein
MICKRVVNLLHVSAFFCYLLGDIKKQNPLKWSVTSQYNNRVEIETFMWIKMYKLQYKMYTVIIVIWYGDKHLLQKFIVFSGICPFISCDRLYHNRRISPGSQTHKKIKCLFFRLGDSPGSECYVPTFRNALSFPFSEAWSGVFGIIERALQFPLNMTALKKEHKIYNHENFETNKFKFPPRTPDLVQVGFLSSMTIL